MMDSDCVTGEEWEICARQTLLKYYSRGGLAQGDTPQLLEGANFINTIGYSLSLVPNVDIESWTADHIKLAQDGAMIYYEGKNLEAIENIVNKLRAAANDSREVFVTILPISFFFTDAFFTLPLYRVLTTQKDGEKVEKFIDHTGRVYVDMDDWKTWNNLPATKIFYPNSGHLGMKEKETDKPDCIVEDSAECSRASKTLMAMDVASGTLGLIAGVGATIATGGAALFLMGGMALTASYGVGRASYKLHDRAKHSETINPFKSRESFWAWLGIGADLITFGTIGAASTKILSSISQSAAFIDISKKFAAATKAMSIFQGVARPATDGAKALMTGYEVFMKLRHKSTNDTLKIPKSALINISSSLGEFSKTNMMLMAISSGYWSKSKMSYVSPEEFESMITEASIKNLVEECSDIEMLQKSINFIANDAELVKAYHKFDGSVDDFIDSIHDIYSADRNQMSIEWVSQKSQIIIDEKFELSLKSLANLTSVQRMKIMQILCQLDEEQKFRLMTIQDFSQSNENFIRMLLYGDFLELLEIWYDVFVICCDHTNVLITEENRVKMDNVDLNMEMMKKLFTRDERLNIIFNLKQLNAQQADVFNNLISAVPDPENYYQMLTSNEMDKENMIAILNAN